VAKNSQRMRVRVEAVEHSQYTPTDAVVERLQGVAQDAYNNGWTYRGLVGWRDTGSSVEHFLCFVRKERVDA
jgi:hypothetical protein